MKGKKKSNKDEDILDEPQKSFRKIGERLKALRISNGYTSYEDFAHDHEIDRSQYGKYERGKDMRISTIIKLLAIHKVNLGDFFQDWNK